MSAVLNEELKRIDFFLNTSPAYSGLSLDVVTLANMNHAYGVTFDGERP